jgi:hypothetical protein
MYSVAHGRYSLRGFSHSEILGSKLVRSSPRLIAAVRVLHRLSSPRHPPCALFSFAVPLRHALSLRPESEERSSLTGLDRDWLSALRPTHVGAVRFCAAYSLIQLNLLESIVVTGELTAIYLNAIFRCIALSFSCQRTSRNVAVASPQRCGFGALIRVSVEPYCLQ